MPICARLGGVWCLIVTIVTIPYACLILSSDCQFNVCEKNFGNFSFRDMILEKVGEREDIKCWKRFVDISFPIYILFLITRLSIFEQLVMC